MVRRYSFLLLALGCALYIAVSGGLASGGGRGIFGSAPVKGREAIIKFSHKFHIEQAGAECITCHAGADSSMRSSDNLLGTMATCGTCHDVEDPEQCLKCHIDNETLVAFENPKREVVFPHATHVKGQNIVCTTCHAGLETVDLSSHDNDPSMEVCASCHNDRAVTNTCESCHTNFVSLLPDNHREAGFRREHREFVRLGSLDASCQTCHSERFCSECHQPAGLKQFGKRDLSAEPNATVTPKDSPKQLALQNVHTLNYRFTHGVDAKSKSTDCTTCHDQREFCAQCHDAGGNINQSKFKPSSHSMPGFTTLGRGSGGGLHATEAKRDLESCVSCHDVEGRDPTCLTCHTPQGGVW